MIAVVVKPWVVFEVPKMLVVSSGVSASEITRAMSWKPCRSEFAFARAFSSGNSSGSSAP
jgi:hypothetical protein